ncbi:hypothetical protein ACN27F_06640 [Solwaraspora sp. WMMB335]|uniref:hypothetical protein n=1 Tax=Solwaraspora sp. WMMB335 TaxID=3404118 RepID=UPI003B949078
MPAPVVPALRADADLPGLHRPDRPHLGSGAATGAEQPPLADPPPAQPGRRPEPLTNPDAVLHLPVRPTWTCTGCGPDTGWPCEWARAELTANLDPISRAIYAAERMTEAAADLWRTATPGELYQRFLSWTRQPRR